MIQFVDLGTQFDELETDFKKAFNEIGRSGSYILGESVRKFEDNVANYCGTKFAIGVANGSDALFLILKALNIGPGDEVITAPNSFIASTWVIIAVGATPVFCDVDKSLNIDVSLLRGKLTQRTKAIIPIHLAGIPCEIEELIEISRVNGLHVIEDCAQAIGAEYNGKKVGSFGIASGFSLHPVKNLGVMGDGGFITTDDEDLYKKLLLLRNHGLKNRDECEIWGYNSRLDEIQAEIARIKLAKLDLWNARHRAIAEMYSFGLREIVETPIVSPHVRPVFHNYIIQTEHRDSLKKYLLEHGVDTRIHYPVPIHLQECASELGYKLGDFPVSERQSRDSLSLPIYPTLSDVSINSVIANIQEFFRTVP